MIGVEAVDRFEQAQVGDLADVLGRPPSFEAAGDPTGQGMNSRTKRSRASVSCCSRRRRNRRWTSRKAVEQAGAQAELLAPKADDIQAMNHDLEPADKFSIDKLVGVICHGPWTLVETDLVRGRTLTSHPSLWTDIRNAGGKVVDQGVVVDEGLVSSRNPDDVPAFCAKIVEEFAEGKHQVALSGATSG